MEHPGHFAAASPQQNARLSFMLVLLLVVLLGSATAVPTPAAPNDMDNVSLSALAGTGTGTNRPGRSLSGTDDATSGSRSGLGSLMAASSSLGGVLVNNNCPFEIYGNIVHAPREEGVVPEEEKQILGPGTGNAQGADSSAFHPYSHDPKVGVSWKFTREDAAGTMQVEWMWSPEQEKVFWDLSLVDGHVRVNASLLESRDSASDRDIANSALAHSFYPYGVAVVPVTNEEIVTQEDDEGNCAPIECSPGQGVCQPSYNVWNDFQAQRDCHQRISLKVELCS